MKFSITRLILTVFLLWLTIQVEQNVELYFAYFFVLTVGILHGANDISLITHILKDKSNKKLSYLLYYVLIVLSIAVSFYLIPFTALLIFVLFSCYHFGEQHFSAVFSHGNKKAKFLYLFYGMLIFGLLFYFNSKDTSSIILELTGVSVAKKYYLFLLIFGLFGTVIFYVINFNKSLDKASYIEDIFLVLLLTLIFKMASILWAFSIYFIVWHSIPSLKDQVVQLHGEFDKTNTKKYLKSSMINWIISLIGLAFLYYFSTYLDIRFITLFFTFLAAITIPHVIVMYHLNKKE